MKNSVSGSLSPRELEILQWILDGKSDADIGAILGISPKTTNYHVENAKRKLGAAHRVRAIALALKAGLLHFRDERQEDADARRARKRSMPAVHASYPPQQAERTDLGRRCPLLLSGGQ